jgi:hypothetical protein
MGSGEGNSPKVLVQHWVCCKQGLTLLTSAVVRYQQRFRRTEFFYDEFMLHPLEKEFHIFLIST